MEVTTLKGSSGDRAALRRSYFRRAWPQPWPRGNDPTSVKTKRRSKAYLTIETPVVACPFPVFAARHSMDVEALRENEWPTYTKTVMRRKSEN